MNILFLAGLSASGKTAIAGVISKQLGASAISLRQDLLHPLAVKYGFKRGRYWVLATIQKPKLLIRERKELLRLIKNKGAGADYVIIDDLIDSGTPKFLRQQLKQVEVLVIRVKTNRHLRKRWIAKRTNFPMKEAIKEQKFLDFVKHKAGIAEAIRGADIEVKNFGRLEKTACDLLMRLAYYLNGFVYHDNKFEANEEEVAIINKKWRIVGHTTRKKAHEMGILHPTVKVVIVSPFGKIYIQKRSSQKSIAPFCWDVSVAEHLQNGENYKEAAVRGLVEELGVVARVKLLRRKHLQKSEYERDGKTFKEYELTALYGAMYDGRTTTDPTEVKDGRFVSLGELERLILGRKVQFTAWGLNEINYLLEHRAIIERLKEK